jgi:hypothetical protein
MKPLAIGDSVTTPGTKGRAALGPIRLGHATKPLRKSSGVAIVATRADLCAARDGIPSRVCPLD